MRDLRNENVFPYLKPRVKKICHTAQYQAVISMVAQQMEIYTIQQHTAFNTAERNNSET